MRKWVAPALALLLVLTGTVPTAKADDTPSYGTVYDFTDLEVTEATQDVRAMPPSETGQSGSALLFRNTAGTGERLTVAFEVDRAADYEVDLQTMLAAVYGRYKISIDGRSLGTHDFYASETRVGELDAIGTLHLDRGVHQLTAEAVGKNADATNYLAAFLQLMLLDAEDRDARVAEVVAVIDDARVDLAEISGDIPAGPADADVALRDRATSFADTLDTLEQRAADAVDDPAMLREIGSEVDAAAARVQRLGNQVEARKAAPDTGYGLATADSMGFAYPEDLPCETCSTGPAEISLAQGEYESLQAVVMAYGTDLNDVSATVTEVVGAGGDRVPESALRARVDPLGSVNVGNTPAVLPELGARPENYEGWIPDPVRTDLSEVDVPAWGMQPFWIELAAGRAIEAGEYRAVITISTADGAEQKVKINAEVWPFAIPDRPDLETSMTTKSTGPLEPYRFSERWRTLEEVYDPNAQEFARLERKYTDLLETFKIEPDLIYNTEPPRVAELRRTEKRWGLRQFNVLYLPGYGDNFDPDRPDSWQPEIDKLLKIIGAAMAKYEKAGLADQAYIYGFDERSDQELASAIFGQVKEQFPDLEIMTTYFDDTFGEDSGLDMVDTWVPSVEKVDDDALQRAHQRGDKVYWYTHQAVRSPLPNWFNGYAPSDTRVLLGPMSHQKNVDGFLYYNVMRWPDREPMADGVLSDWDPQTYHTANGDGSLFYPGPAGPLSSQRLHNFRDGMEDYNLLNELEQMITEAEDGGAPEPLLRRAREVVAAKAVVTSVRDYTKDPAEYREWRSDVGGMITALAATTGDR